MERITPTSNILCPTDDYPNNYDDNAKMGIPELITIVKGLTIIIIMGKINK